MGRFGIPIGSFFLFLSFFIFAGTASRSESPPDVSAPRPDPDDVYWDSGFQLPGGNREIQACAMDSTGMLYVGGLFTEMAGVPARGIAQWDGQTWSLVGEGLGGGAWVEDLAADGSDLYAVGTDLMIGTDSANGIARWDGSTWSTVGEGLGGQVVAVTVSGGRVYAGGISLWLGTGGFGVLAVWDGVTWSRLGESGMGMVRDIAVNGDAVYVSGFFSEINGVPVDGLAVWDGSAWSDVGGGTGGGAIEVLDGNLYAARTNGVDRWDGVAWEPLGTGTDGEVTCLSTGEGFLYAGGAFTTAGGISARNIAKWDGSAWSSAGYDLPGMSVDTIVVQGADALYAGVLSGVAKWNGTSWAFLGSGFQDEPGSNTQEVHAVASNGKDIYIGGRFQAAGGIPAWNIVHWDGVSWSALGDGLSFTVHAIQIDGQEVYAGGNNWSGGTPEDPTIVRWDGSAWQPLGDGVGGLVYSMARDETGLYVGGMISTAGGSPANGVARWDGANWHALGEGIEGYVYALALNEGDLYAAGDFIRIGTQDAQLHNMAKWDGSAWELLEPGVGETVRALAADGLGNIYAGGEFYSIGGVELGYVGRWDGTEWSPLGSGVDRPVEWIEVKNGKVYAGGRFIQAGGRPARGVAVWDGVEWSAFGSGIEESGVVNAGGIIGDALLLGGRFSEAGDKSSPAFARWMPRVNVSSFEMEQEPLNATLGDDPHGFYKPFLVTNEKTYLEYPGAFPVTVTMREADEIHVDGIRINGAFTLEPEGIEFIGNGAWPLRVEFSGDDAAAFGTLPEHFRAARLTYPPDYPENKEAASVESLDWAEPPVPVRYQNGRQIWGIDVYGPRSSGTYGAVPAESTRTPAHFRVY